MPLIPDAPRSRLLPRALAVVRDADWLDADRARAWSTILGLATITIAVIWVSLSQNGIDYMGHPLGTDFQGFWSASQLALSGSPASAYDPQTQAALQQELFPLAKPEGYNPFLYPPVFLLLCLPLALLPYFVSLSVWLVSGLLLLLACIRQTLPERWAVVPTLAFPGVLNNLGHGHNGFISASCFGGGMLLLERFPLLAGFCFGGLVFKPHLAVAVPIALIAARRWRAFAGAAASVVVLCSLSYLVLGQEAWLGFVAASNLSKNTIEHGLMDPAKIQSLYAAVLVLHGNLTMAYLSQIILTLAVAALVVKTVVRRPGGAAEGALIISASVLSTPYLVDYDLVCLAFPLAWVMAEAQKNGWRPWEKIILLMAYLLPILSRTIAMRTGLPVGPFIMMCLLMVVWKRASYLPTTVE